MPTVESTRAGAMIESKAPQGLMLPIVGEETDGFPFAISTSATDMDGGTPTEAPQGLALTSEGKPLNAAPAAEVQAGHRAQWIQIPNPVDRIVDILARYLYLHPVRDKFESSGRRFLRGVVGRAVERKERLQIVFPGFPFKSPSRRKVLGALPDYAEELLLRRLEALARSVEDYYSPGVVVRIVSDGIVYGDVLGRCNETIYRYNHELRRMAGDFGLSHISFIRLADLLSHDSLKEDSDFDVDADRYLRSIPRIRSEFLAHEVPGFNLTEALQSDDGVLATYRGYLKFLEADLEGEDLFKWPDGRPLSNRAQEKVRRGIAKQMILNGSKFSDLVSRKFPTAVRISCHTHPNVGPKFALNMFPGAARAASPWHNAICQRADGTLAVGHVRAFESVKHEIVERYGRPYYLRELSDAWSLGDKIDPHVTYTPQYPFGLLIEADPNTKLTFNDLPMAKVRALAFRHSALCMRGFAQVDRHDFRKKCQEFGDVVTWPQFGAILELKENPDLDMNSSLTCESMPLHYDGIFKTKRLPNGELTHDPPNFQVFQCVHAPMSSDGGKTLLTNTNLLLQHGLTAAQRQWLSTREFSVYTPQNTVFGGDVLKLPMVIRNENTEHDVLRWHENWPQWTTKYKYAESRIQGVSSAESAAIGDLLTDLLYDRRFCYAHTWMTGDFLISDNVETMHTRTAFRPCPRELWRIHVN